MMIFSFPLSKWLRNVSERVLPLPASILASVLCKRIVVEVVEGEGVEAIPAMAGTCGTRQNTHLIKVVEIAAATGAATGHLGIPLTAAMRVTARLLPNMVPIVADDLRWRSVDVFHDLTLGICYWSVGYF